MSALKLVCFCLVVVVFKECTAWSWTNWMDRDNPSATGDWEIVSEFKSKACNGRAVTIQARVKGESTVILSAQERITVSPWYGLVCQNHLQTDRYCRNYFVHYLGPFLSRRYNRDGPSGTGDWEAKRLHGYRSGTHIYWSAGDSSNYGIVNERLEVGPRYGLVCQNRLQLRDRYCQDYEVRFLCP